MTKKHKILILKLLIDGRYEDFVNEMHYITSKGIQQISIEMLFMEYFACKMIGDSDQCAFYSEKINQILMNEDLEDFIGWLRYSGPPHFEEDGD